MSKLIVSAAATALAAATLAAAPASAHDGVKIKAAGKCDPITQAQWRQVKPGMSLEDVEHVIGCEASHYQTNNFKTFTADNYFFKTGGRSLAEVQFKNGKLWQKYGYHSGL